MAGAGESGGDFRASPLPPKGEKRRAASPLVPGCGALPRLQDEGHRTVVEDVDVHEGLEDAGLDGDAEGLDGADEILEELGRPARLLGPVEARPPALADRGGQRELGDGQDLAADVARARGSSCPRRRGRCAAPRPSAPGTRRPARRRPFRRRRAGRRPGRCRPTVRPSTSTRASLTLWSTIFMAGSPCRGLPQEPERRS